MAQSLKTVKSRIRSIENIRKITRAMEMVSSSKLKALQKEYSAFAQYYSRMEKMLNDLLASFPSSQNILLKPRLNKQKIILCVVTSDTGLCGSYNNNVIRIAEEFIEKNKDYALSLVAIGKKGLNHFKKSKLVIADTYTELYGHYSYEVAQKLVKFLLHAFLSGAADEVYAAYTNFISASRVKPVIGKVLNVERGDGEAQEYLSEPDIDTILKELVPAYVAMKMKNIILSSFTAENATRVMAMHEATDNAVELLDDLVLVRNKIRQADITRELIEVVSSADAMKG
ncbi:MAG: ATP synthase F1 subunit gamma [Candidatus Omnitrophica bacterium]|nr:ATP synthase F1 subunit gamma [Candidatus Omnitrophota bacterium]MDD5610651.1 ATP synthase F1 subunit gamma [Candidatus Omnitrophota bacterium]